MYDGVYGVALELRKRQSNRNWNGIRNVLYLIPAHPRATDAVYGDPNPAL